MTLAHTPASEIGTQPPPSDEQELAAATEHGRVVWVDPDATAPAEPDDDLP